MRRTRRLLAFAGVVASATVLAGLLGGPLGGLTGVRSFEDFTLDLRQQTTPESFQSGRGGRESEIVLVLFDEFSVLDPDQGWDWISPFPRAHLARVVDALDVGGARAIGLDVYLDELFEGLNRIDGGNALLRDAMERAGSVILVAPTEETDSGSVLRRPHPYFAHAAADVGSADLPSAFETFRDGALAVRSGGALEPSFVLALYAHARGFDVDSLLAVSRQAGRIGLPGLPRGVGVIPEAWRRPDGARERGSGSDDAGPDDPGSDAVGSILPFRIRYHGPPTSADAEAPPGTFQVLPSSAVETLAETLEDPVLADFAAETLRGFFEDRIVLMGTGFHPEDRFRTPFFGSPVDGGDARYEWMYGVEIHANALQNLLDGSYVRPLGPASRVLLLLALVALAAGGVFLGGQWLGAAATVTGVLGAWALGFWAWAGTVYLPGVELARFSAVGAWVPIATPVLAALLGYVQSVAYTALVEGRDKRILKGAFGKYTSPVVVAEILESPEALALGGEKRPLSILFSDLSGFTSIAEEMDAEELISLLNEYLNDMTQVVFDERGYLDKYIGDAIMAFWNAPVDVPDHADRALRTAVFMQRRMADLNRRWSDAGRDVALKVRIGVHTGEVIVGNVGGEDRFDYSAIGDAVNLAARLEPANKTYDTFNMVSEVTLAAARDDYRVRELDTIAVKGKDEPVRVYELLELGGGSLPPEKEAALEHFAAGMEAYRAHDWSEALARFEAAVTACPDDGPSRLYVERCRAHRANPPQADWDFVVRRTEK